MFRYRIFRPLLVAALLASTPVLTPAQARSPIFSGVPIEAIVMRSGSTAAKVRKLKSVPSVGVTNVRARGGIYFTPRFRDNRRYTNVFDDDPFFDRFDNRLLISRNSAGVKRLQVALRSNPVTRRALRRVNINRVIGADVYSDGSIRVYVY
jgi:hypothetical protein